MYLFSQAKAHKCFHSKESLNELCGDGLLSAKEHCDIGLYNESNKDRCCASKCKFRTGAVCSPHHHPCCTEDCQLASNTQTCINDLGNECARESTCDGVDAFTCPIPTPKPNGAVCGENGTCWNGHCYSFCENLGRVQEPPRQLQSCNCEESPESMCQLCCMDVGSPGEGSCKKVGGARRDGSPCLRGTCQRGVCTEGKDNTLNIGKLEGSKDDPNEDNGDNGLIVKVIIVGVAAVVFITSLAVIVMGLMSRETRTLSREEEAIIEELRRSLQDAIGHLNVSPDDDDDPIAVAIKTQLAKERKRRQSEKPVQSHSHQDHQSHMSKTSN